MKFFLVILIILVATLTKLTSANQTLEILDQFADKSVEEQYAAWRQVHNKVPLRGSIIDSNEEAKRFQIFKTNFDRVQEVNSKKGSYTLGLTEFADLTFEEFKDQYLMKDLEQFQSQAFTNMDAPQEQNSKFLNIERSLQYRADSPDWSYLYEGVVRHQGQCGSCWAFATTGAIEGHLAKDLGKYQMLSTQQIVDCNTSMFGCKGGWLYNTGPYESQGLVSESAYPYTSGQTLVQGYCDQYKVQNNQKFKISGYRYCETVQQFGTLCAAGEYEQAYERGPVYVLISANRDFQLYRGGIFDSYCGTDLHAVVGVQLTSQYVKIRNSWGAQWGENGYIRVKRNPYNYQSCFTEKYLWYPTGIKH